MTDRIISLVLVVVAGLLIWTAIILGSDQLVRWLW